MSDRSGIYAIEHVATHRVYIGSSVCISARWREHRHSLRKGKHHASHLQHAWDKYGRDAFAFYVLEDCERDQLLIREQEYIDAFKPVFNVCPLARSRLGTTVSQETKEKIRVGLIAYQRPFATHCRRGHPYSGDNLYIAPGNGMRVCKACRELRYRAAYPDYSPGGKTHCKYGHPFSGDNLLFHKKQRVCRECHRRTSLEYLHRKRALAQRTT